MSQFNAAFWKWFGGSVLHGEYGMPLVMFHGTQRDFSAFSQEMVKARFSVSLGFHFTSDPGEASQYADEEGSSVMPVFVKAERPLFIETQERASLHVDVNRFQIIRELLRAKKAGTPYDSVVVRNTQDGHVNAVVFKPTQIKSATGNDGTWDTSDPDIRSNPMQILGLPVELESSFVADGVQYDLFRLVERDGSIIRVLDQDSDNVVTMKRFPSFERGKQEFLKTAKALGL